MHVQLGKTVNITYDCNCAHYLLIMSICIFLEIFLVLTYVLKLVIPQNHCDVKHFFTTFYTCDINDVESMQQLVSDKCKQFISSNSSPNIFLFYDVNSVEGFNLRRDVYIRMAVFTKFLRQQIGYENVKLVLPPFYQLYHWRVVQPSEPSRILFWNHFFDLDSLKKYTEVIDLWQYFDIVDNCFSYTLKFTNPQLDYVFKLTHFASMFSSGKFEEKYEIGNINCENERRRIGNQFINLYDNFTISKFLCTEYQGSAMLLHNLFQDFVERFVFLFSFFMELNLIMICFI